MKGKAEIIARWDGGDVVPVLLEDCPSLIVLITVTSPEPPEPPAPLEKLEDIDPNSLLPQRDKYSLGPKGRRITKERARVLLRKRQKEWRKEEEAFAIATQEYVSARARYGRLGADLPNKIVELREAQSASPLHLPGTRLTHLVWFEKLGLQCLYPTDLLQSLTSRPCWESYALLVCADEYLSDTCRFSARGTVLGPGLRGAMERKKVLRSFPAVYDQLWMFRGFLVRVFPQLPPLTKEEAGLLALEAVLKREKRFQKLSQVAGLEGKLVKASRREPIPDEVRLFIWKRDEGRCVKCGSRENLEFDHIIPVSKGGSNTARNLQLLCESCNRSKSDSI